MAGLFRRRAQNPGTRESHMTLFSARERTSLIPIFDPIAVTKPSISRLAGYHMATISPQEVWGQRKRGRPEKRDNLNCWRARNTPLKPSHHRANGCKHPEWPSE